ncbi:hypothetical protein NQ318_005620 [Aromia moschata]|uniref:SHSP domain-containing protein n=1 Tax=Aromia moschata TaxID=1265417 RepID=A0AAV8X7J1_9CUCU|nr:hypothetical protein NQ318_005620 [Aromia moschata]
MTGGGDGEIQTKLDLFALKVTNHGTPKTITVDEEDEILIRVLESPGLEYSSAKCGNGAKLINFEKEILHLYLYTPVQQLLPQDLPSLSIICSVSTKYSNRKPRF